jgi:hypothetical protein
MGVPADLVPFRDLISMPFRNHLAHRARRSGKDDSPALFYAFDLLYLDGHDPPLGGIHLATIKHLIWLGPQVQRSYRCLLPHG